MDNSTNEELKGSKTYLILNEGGDVENRIVAEHWFVDEFYPGRYREYIEPEPIEPSEPEEDTEKQ